MKRIVLFSFLAASILLFSVQRAVGQDYRSAVGIRLSSSVPVINNSVSFKHFFSENMAVEALLSVGDPVAIGALLEWHHPFNTTGLSWYYGAGLYAGFEPESALGAQGVIGLDYQFAHFPINLSLDWKPELNLVREINAEPAAIGLSIRFSFGARKKLNGGTVPYDGESPL